MTQREPIEGEYSTAEPEPGHQVVKRAEPGAVQIFNPLDAQPEQFRQQLQNRQDNYDALAMHLRGVLIPGKDFGKIHVAKGCDNKWNCENPRHFSGYELFASGADKILGILGLAVAYPDLQDYKRAVLKGLVLAEVIADAQILGSGEQVIASGAGACTREQVNGDLNRCIKMACKRARLDAVKRLPVVSALFEADFLAEIEADAARNKGNTTAGRARQVNPAKKWDTGARLDVCPVGKKHHGKPWREIPTEYLEWMQREMADKPDVLRAVVEELSKRTGPPPSVSGSSSTHTRPPPVFDERNPPPLEDFDDDIPF